MKNRQLKLGNFLFKFRSFTPLPLILMVFVFFKPVDLGEKNIIINLIGLLISLLGESIRVAAVGYSFSGTSGRESYLKADNLNTTGIYSVARNPLYIGNFFIFSGLLVLFANILALLIFALFLLMQYYFIILAEEDFLKKEYGAAYESYCRQVGRIFPTFKNYKKNRDAFNFKKVVFKENDSLFNLLVMYLLLLLYKEKTFSAGIGSPVYYIIPGIFLVISYIIIKIFKRGCGAPNL